MTMRMKWTTRPLAALCALSLLLLSLAGCSGQKSEPAAGSTAPKQEAAKTDAAKPPFKLGVLLPYSKVYAALGESITNGMSLYFEQAGGTAGGRKIEMIKEDEESDAQASLQKATKLIERDKVDMMTGLVSTAVAYALRDLVHNTKTVLLVSNAGGDKLTREMKSPYIFRTSFTSYQVSHPMGKWVADNIAKEVFITAADYSFGREVAADFKAAFIAAGGKVVGEVYPKLGNEDYGPYLAQVKEAKPKATFHFYAGADAVKFVQQWEQFGLSGIPLVGTGFMIDEDVLLKVGKAGLGAKSSLHWAVDLENPENKKFVAEYQAKFKKLPDIYALQGYDTARVIVEAVNATKGDTANKDALVKAMESVKFASPRGQFQFDPETHQVINDIYVRDVKQNGSVFSNSTISTIKGVKDPAK